MFGILSISVINQKINISDKIFSLNSLLKLSNNLSLAGFGVMQGKVETNAVIWVGGGLDKMQ
jgi:hypothetical protein